MLNGAIGATKQNDPPTKTSKTTKAATKATKSKVPKTQNGPKAAVPQLAPPNLSKEVIMQDPAVAAVGSFVPPLPKGA